MSRSHLKLKVFGSTFAVFAISAGAFINISTNKQDIHHTHAASEWELNVTNGYHYNSAEGLEARPYQLFYYESSGIVRMDCNIYDVSPASTGETLTGQTFSFDFRLTDSVPQLVGNNYEFTNLTCEECGATLQTFSFGMPNVGVIVSQYDNAPWEFNSSLGFHQKVFVDSSPQYDYTAIPKNIVYDFDHSLLKVECDVSIFDLQNNYAVTYSHEPVIFWYTDAQCNRESDSSSYYSLAGTCITHNVGESFSIDSETATVDTGDLSEEFPETEPDYNYQDGWNYNSSSLCFVWKQPEVSDPRPQDTRPTQVGITNDRIVITYTHSTNPAYSPTHSLIFQGGSYNENSHIVNCTTNSSFYDCVTGETIIAGTNLDVFIYDLTPVEAAAENFGLSPTEMALNVGQTSSFEIVEVIPSNAGVFVFESDSNVIECTQDGQITAIAEGTAIVMCTDLLSDLMTEARVVVSAGSSVNLSIYLNGEPVHTLTLPIGSTVEFTVETDSSGAGIEPFWTSDNSDIATVEDGVVTSISNSDGGPVTISVTDESTGASASVVITYVSLGILYGGEPMVEMGCEVGNSFQLDAQTKPADWYPDLEWYTSDPSVATLKSSDTLSTTVDIIGAGQADIVLTDKITGISTTLTIYAEDGEQLEAGWNCIDGQLIYVDPEHPNYESAFNFAVLYESDYEIVKLYYNIYDIETEKLVDVKIVTLTYAKYSQDADIESNYTITGDFDQISDQQIYLTVSEEQCFIPDTYKSYYFFNGMVVPDASTIMDTTQPLYDLIEESAVYDEDGGTFEATYCVYNPFSGGKSGRTENFTVLSAKVSEWPTEDPYVFVSGTVYGEEVSFYFRTSAIEKSSLDTLNITIDGEVVGTDFVCQEGDMFPLGVTYTPEDEVVDITWTTEDESIVYIGPNGYLEATGVGQATIICIDNESGKSVECTIVVKEKEVTVPMVYFNANGGEGQMDPIPAPEGMIYAPDCAFTREGYTFTKWTTIDGVSYLEGQKVEGIFENITLFANWKKNETTSYTITFDPNGGVGEMSPIQVEKGYNEVPSCDFTREGYSFAGWAAGSPDGTVVKPGESVYVNDNYTLYALWAESVKPITPVAPVNPIDQDTIDAIEEGLSNLGLDEEQTQVIVNIIEDNKEYISNEAGTLIAQALAGTQALSSEPEIKEAQVELISTVVEVGVEVDSGKAGDIGVAASIEENLPDKFLASEMAEFYELQMRELFGASEPSNGATRAARVGTPSIDIDTGDRPTDKAVEHLNNETELYKTMTKFVDDTVDHMSKAALKLRKCSGEKVVTSVKSYVSRIKVISFREYPAAEELDKFVEALYDAMMLSMQEEVISMLEKDHKPNSNKGAEAQYQKELEAVKDPESFEIMVVEVMRQKYVALTGDETYTTENLEEFKKDIFDPIFRAWALDEDIPQELKDKGINFTLEELTKAAIEQSTGRSQAFTMNEKMTGSEWGFVAGIVGGAIVLVAAAAIIPGAVKKYKLKMKEAE